MIENSVSGCADADYEVYVSNQEDSGNNNRQVVMACQNEVAQHILNKDYMIPVSMTVELNQF